MIEVTQKFLRMFPSSHLGLVNQKSFKLDPQIRLFLAFSNFMKDPHLQSVEDARKTFTFASRQAFTFRREDVLVQNLSITGSKRTIPARLYTPAEFGEGSGLILFMHGGGWVLGNLESHDRFCRALAKGTSHAVMAVDYALSPEYPFPVALHEGLESYIWLQEHIDSLLNYPRSILVCGDSAGGNLVTSLCFLCKQKGIEQPSGQILFYPVTNLASQSASRREFANGFLLSLDTMKWFERHYAHGQDASNPLISPLHALDCKGIAPAMIFLAGFDILYDEGLAYARLLKKQGVQVDLHIVERQIHGFANLAGLVPSASKDLNDCVRKIARWEAWT